MTCEGFLMYSRREFLVRTIWLPLLSATLKAFASERPTTDGTADFRASDIEILATTMDEIIPPGDGMPPASRAGGPEYLQYLGWQYPAIQEEMSQFLEMVEQQSAARFRQDFGKLQPEMRAPVLVALEKDQPTRFSSFVTYVYESYYTNPRVLGLIWCSSSPSSIENHESLLAPVRRLTHMYRKVP